MTACYGTVTVGIVSMYVCDKASPEGGPSAEAGHA